jgi:hypothetical protein
MSATFWLRCALAVGLLASLPALAPAQTAPGAGSAPASAPPSTNRDQVQRRIASTATLISTSSGAKQVEASGKPEALAKLKLAREQHAQAQAAFDAGDMDATNKLLYAVAKSLMEAVARASPEQVTARKERADFDARLESTRTLLDASRRIAQEKGQGNTDLVKKIETLITQANALAQGNKLGEARQVLDQAYGAVRGAIGVMRSGDTLVRSLNFANKEEEFHYEVDRNDTHRMLVQVLLADRRAGNTSMDSMINKAMDESAQLRQQADDMARRKDFDAGVKTLEESTRSLVKAIRAAGVYIPG